ncbi:hypothetical protein [Occallatibacter savannae]|uniref:hypothetical protein n=1 Tax=Occallatibacter savannae TaxID=1002691 RepID=UPI000D68F73A|nr:hypothetical protein [Occallatibacter savannae]
MTEFNCWIDLTTDKRLKLRVEKGIFGGQFNSTHVWFPAPPNNYRCWPGVVAGWCKERNLNPVWERLDIRVTVTKAQIEDFIDYVYRDDASYWEPAKMLMWEGRAYLANSLTNLRAFVAQELNPKRTYELKADEY